MIVLDDVIAGLMRREPTANVRPCVATLAVAHLARRARSGRG